MCDHVPMDMTDLEDVARRYGEATNALDAVRTEMQTMAVALLQQPGTKQADIARITGWSREHLRRLRDKAEAEAEKARHDAEMEALRRKVEELSAAAQLPAGKSATKDPSRTATPTRSQVTQAIPVPAPSATEDERVALPDEEVKRLNALGRLKATSEQQERLQRVVATAKSMNRDPDIAVLDALFEMGLLTDADVQH